MISVRLKIMVMVLAGMFLFLASFASGENEPKNTQSNSEKTVQTDDLSKNDTSQFVVYYFHGNRRCPTCKKLEAYTGEAVSDGFVKELNDSTVIWKVINFESEGNEHFVKDYQLYSQSVILSRIVDGKEAEWKNLDKIWELVSDKDKFIDYVQNELTDFMKPVKK